MIGAAEIEQAINASVRSGRGDTFASYAALGLDLATIDTYARRYLEVAHDSDLPYDNAVGGGFLLGFELGYRVGASARPAGSSRET